MSRGRRAAIGYVAATVGNGFVCVATWHSSARWLSGILLTSIVVTAFASVATIYGCIRGWDRQQASP